MGIYSEALAIAAQSGAVPSIQADDHEGRHKYGLGLNGEMPLADQGDTGVFMRAGWDDGKSETFAFTEVDREESAGMQVSGVHWARPADRFGAALVSQGLSGPHRAYLAAGGCGFLLCGPSPLNPTAGPLMYGPEEIFETYYRLEFTWPQHPGPLRWQLSPDFQYIRNPGYEENRGPVRFWALRLHFEY